MAEVTPDPIYIVYQVLP